MIELIRARATYPRYQHEMCLVRGWGHCDIKAYAVNFVQLRLSELKFLSVYLFQASPLTENNIRRLQLTKSKLDNIYRKSSRAIPVNVDRFLRC